MRVANTELIDALAADGALSLDEFEKLLTTYTAADRDHAASRAYRIAREQFGTHLGAWGVVSVSNVCTKDCRALPAVGRRGARRLRRGASIGHPRLLS